MKAKFLSIGLIVAVMTAISFSAKAQAPQFLGYGGGNTTATTVNFTFQVSEQTQLPLTVEFQIYKFPDTTIANIVLDTFWIADSSHIPLGLSNLTPNTNYLIKLGFRNTYGMDIRYVTFQTEIASGIGVIDEAKCLIFSTQEAIKINLIDQAYTGSLCSIYSMDGQKVFEKTLESQYATVPLTTGIYEVVILSKEGLLAKKILVN